MSTRSYITKLLVLEFIILFSIAYTLYLFFLYPIFIPGYGFGESIYLDSSNNYTYISTVTAPRTSLHIILSGNSSFNVMIGEKIYPNVRNLEFIVNPYQKLELKLSSEHPVLVKLSGRNEIPYLEAIIFTSLGILSTTLFIRIYKRWKHIIRLSKRQ